MLPSSPAPMPDTTKASEGFVQRGISDVSSSFPIIPLLYFAINIFAPRGNPQTLPIKNASRELWLIPKGLSSPKSLESGGKEI